MSGRRPLPNSARILVAAVVATGALALVAPLSGIGAWNRRDLAAWAVLVVVIAVAEQFSIPLRHKTETVNFTITDAVWMGALLLAPRASSSWRWWWALGSVRRPGGGAPTRWCSTWRSSFWGSERPS